MGEKIEHIHDIKERMEERISIMEKALAEVKIRKHSFTPIESVLIAYCFYWVCYLFNPAENFNLYPIYTDLSKIFTEMTLEIILTSIGFLMTAGCWFNLIKIRLFALSMSLIIWLIIASSIVQENPENMRGSVFILAVASGWQFVQLVRAYRMKAERRR